MNFTPVIERYQEELKRCISFWETHCIDHENGGFFTSLNHDGSVYDREKYMWMQWRSVYMFATLAKTSWNKPEFIRIARNGFDFLTAHGKSEDGTYYFALNEWGEPSIAPYNIFSDCFAAMGAAALYAVTGEDIHRQEAESAIQNYIRRMDTPKGRWEKRLSGAAKRLSLGHFMILANLGSVMRECLGTDHYEADTGRAVKTVMEKFWNKDKKVIFENVNPDGSFDLNSSEGRMINPGHGLESMWFIMQYAERHNDAAMIAKAADYTRGILEFGMDKQHGGLYYFMDVLGKPHLELQWDMKLWWPHCEGIVAALHAYRLTGDEYFLRRFQELDEWSFHHFRDPEYGEWYGYLNRRGEPTHKLKGGKWKTFFHLPRALLVSIEQMRRCKSASADPD